MIIKRLPYPMYYDGSPDYYGTFFNTEIDISDEQDPLHILLKGKFSIGDKEISSLIDDGRAFFALLIECPSTNYKELRKCYRLFSEKLIKANFSDSITVTPMIIASEDICDYSHSELVDSFKNINCTIPKGGIIAFDDDYNISITRGTPQSVETICKFTQDFDNSEHYTIDDKSIYISLPTNVYESYKIMNKIQRTSLTSIYFPPVLIDILSRMYLETDSLDDYSNSKWYIAIDDAIKNRGVDPTVVGPYNAAMDIISGLLEDGSINISNMSEAIQ